MTTLQVKQYEIQPETTLDLPIGANVLDVRVDADDDGSEAIFLVALVDANARVEEKRRFRVLGLEDTVEKSTLGRYAYLGTVTVGGAPYTAFELLKNAAGQRA